MVIGGGAAGDGFEAKVQGLGIVFVPLPISRRPVDPISDCWLLWTLFRWYRRERPDVVHHFTIRPVLYGSMAAWLAGVPKIINTVSGLGTVFGEGQKAWLRFVVETQYRLALSLAHMTFFQNAEDYRLFISKGLVKAEKADVVPGSGVDCTLFQPPSQSETAPQGQVTFLMSSRLLREKGVYDFVQAARIVQQKYPRSRFQLLGKRDERNPQVIPKNDLEQWEKEGVITWLGEVSDVRPIVATADVVVLPSYYREGVPRTLLEASAMGKPIIATEMVGCRDVVDPEKNGMLVPVRDPEALALAMIRMIESPTSRREMGKAGREKVMTKFDERFVIERTLASYN